MKKTFLALLLSLMLAVGTVPTVASSAAGDIQSLDMTKVEDDLEGVIDPADYPADPYGEVRLVEEMGFAEYAYSLREDLKDLYGVYFYVYNPQELSLRKTGNVVNIATSFAEDGTALGYNNLDLALCSVSGNGLFLKFRISMSWMMLQMEQNYAKTHGGERVYKISGIQLWEEGEQNAVDYAVEKTFTCSGFATGCGSDPKAESTLTVTQRGLMTLDIPLTHTNAAGEIVQNDTYYRTETSSLGANHRWQINSVYFSVDKEIDDAYTKLQRIRATWYEYQTSPILLTMNAEVYSDYFAHRGESVGGLSQSQLKEKFHYGVGEFGSFVDGLEDDSCYWNGWTYAIPQYWYPASPFADDVINFGGNPLDKLAWVFETQTAGWNKISSEELMEYMKEYSAAHPGTASDAYLAEKGFSEDLFTQGTALHANGNQAKRGKNVFDFDADETVDLRSYNSTLPGWDKLLRTLFGIGVGAEWQIDGMEPIHKVEGRELDAFRDEDVADALYINELDVNEFRTWAKAEMNAGKAVYLFRFAVTDYEQQTMHLQNLRAPFGEAGSSGVPMEDGMGTVMAQEAVFLGFEVIHLGYRTADGKLEIIPVVQSPIDIVPDVDVWIGPEVQDGNWLWWCMIAGVAVILLMIADGFIETRTGGTTI